MNKARWIGAWIIGCCWLSGREALAMNGFDIPAEAPNDAVMASAGEVKGVSDWTRTAFESVPSPQKEKRVQLEVIRQDYNVLRFGRSCMETPIRIGSREFKHGLGTHARSEIAVTLPPGAKRFEAFVGIDHNDDTGGVRGSVQFFVEANGQRIVETPVLRGSDEPIPIKTELPDGASRLLLVVDTTPDGPTCDQADWADARLVMKDGSVKWLDENQDDGLLIQPTPPFSFVYDGASSTTFLKDWKRSVETSDFEDRTERRIVWDDPKGALRVTAAVKTFKRYPAADWVINFENRGTEDTPILEKIEPLDVSLRTGNSMRDAVLHQLNGDACGENSFLPVDRALPVGESIKMAPTDGRSSNTTAFPFFNLQYADEGLIAAVGWSGQWAASLDRSGAGPTQLRAGMEETHLKLHPGEKIRAPRILLMPWKGDQESAYNRFRRLILFQYAPRINGKPAPLPVALQCFDRYNSRLGWATEAGQIEAVRTAAKLGCDSLWLDAAWFPKGFPNGVGSWFHRPEDFPRGLKPVSDEAHKKDMRFILWFEPERVAPDTEIAKEHPDFVFGGANGGLFKLSDPAARRWLTDRLSQKIDEYGIDVYRNDFNIDPLSFWRNNDAPDRQGMTEIQYIEGLYEMWDELRARHPGLMIDNCASGGRRIDLETCSRSVPLWRSDTGCWAGHPEWNQNQVIGFSRFLPLHTISSWTPDPYEARSAATGGAICEWDVLDKDFPTDLAKKTLKEIRKNQSYWYGDFYAITPPDLKSESLIAYQLHRPDADSGIVLAFRRRDCSIVGLIVGLKGLKPDVKYQVERWDDSRERTTFTATGKELAKACVLRIDQKGGSLLLRYQPVKKG